VNENYLKTPIDLLLDKSLKSTDKIILQYLLWRQGENGKCWPAERTIANELNLNLETVQNSLARLAKNKKISIQKSEKRGKGHSNKYTVIDRKNQSIEIDCAEKPVNNDRKNQSAIDRKNQSKKKPYKTNHKNTPYSGDSIELKLASLLLEKILERKPDFKKPNLQQWAADIDLMIRRESRKPEVIERVIVWCQADSGNGNGWAGWQNNILSTAKLRDKFDRLELKMQEKQNEKQNGKKLSANRRDYSEPAASRFGESVSV
jgi:DNA-binding transcriptional regulator YhcF (GntR family)